MAVLSTKASEGEYVFQVAIICGWQVVITRYELVKWTKLTLTVRGISGKEERHHWKINGMKSWFLNYEQAKKDAEVRCANLQQRLNQSLAELNDSKNKIKKDEFHIVTPIDTSHFQGNIQI